MQGDTDEPTYVLSTYDVQKLAAGVLLLAGVFIDASLCSVWDFKNLRSLRGRTEFHEFCDYTWEQLQKGPRTAR